MQNAGIDHLVVTLGADRKVRKAVDTALVGAIKNFPVDQAAIAGQPNTAGANAAQREADLAGLGTAIDEVVHWFFL